MQGLKCIPDGLSIELTSFPTLNSFFSLLLVLLPYIGFHSFILQFSHRLLPPCLPPTLLALHQQAFLFSSFYFFSLLPRASACLLPIHFPSLSSLLLYSPFLHKMTTALVGTMINRLSSTGFQESGFLPSFSSMGTQAFNSSPARTAGGNPLGHLYWHLLQRTKT